MRINTTIQVTSVKPINTTHVCVYFFDVKTKEKYKWSTTSWRSGSDITFATNGQQFKVSFRLISEPVAISECHLPFSVENLRVLK